MVATTNNLTQDKTDYVPRDSEDDSYPDAYCYVCTERIEYCRCEPGEGANRLDSLDLTDSDLLEDVEYTRLRRLHPTEFAQVGGVRDF